MSICGRAEIVVHAFSPTGSRDGKSEYNFRSAWDRNYHVHARRFVDMCQARTQNVFQININITIDIK